MKKFNLLTIGLFSIILFSASSSRNEAPSPNSAIKPVSLEEYFLENKGQLYDQYYNPRPDIRFYGSGASGSWYLRDDGISYQFFKYLTDNFSSYLKQKRRNTLFPPVNPDSVLIHRVDMILENASPNVTWETSGQSSWHYNFYNVPSGEPALFARGYREVTARNILDGVDLQYHYRNGSLETDLHLKKAAHLNNIHWRVEGAESIYLDESGNLVIETPLGKIMENKPLGFQEGKTIEGAWLIQENKISYCFRQVDETKSILIDPPIRLWNILYGGTGYDAACHIESDNSGNLFVTGFTASTSNIATIGTHQSTHGGATDAFLLKFNRNGNLIWGTYYGDSNQDVSYSVFATSDYVYIGGQTTSTNNISTNSTNIQGNYDGFLAKFNSNNGTRVWGSYYGGTLYDGIHVIKLNSEGEVIIAGHTLSANLPNTPSGAQSVKVGSSSDAFVAKLYDNSSVNVIVSTYLGGNNSESVSSYGMVIGANDRIYICGETDSDELFPVSNTTNTFLSDELIGENDIFITCIENDLSEFIFSGYYGGEMYEFIPTLSKHPSQDLFSLTFETYSETIDGQNINNTNYTNIFWLRFDQTFSPNSSAYSRQFLNRQTNCNADYYTPNSVFIGNDLVAVSYLTYNKIPDFPDNYSWDTEASSDGNIVFYVYSLSDPYYSYGTFEGNNIFYGIGISVLIASYDNHTLYIGSSDYANNKDIYLSRFDIRWIWNGTSTDTIWSTTNSQPWKNGMVPPYQNFHENEAGQLIYPDIVIPSGKKAVISDNNFNYGIAHAGNLTIQPNGQLIVDANFQGNYANNLRVHGRLINLADTSGLILRSNINRTAQLLHNQTNPNDPAAKAIIERYIRGYGNNQWDAWHFISSPVLNQPISEFDQVGGDDDFYQWNEPLDLWINRTDQNGNLNTAFETNFVPGKGYLIAKQAGTLKKFKGEVNVNNVSITGLTKTPNTTYSGWHLIGNPFACPVIWHNPDDGINWNLSNIDANAQVWIGTYASYSIIYPGDHIPSAKGFMIHVNDDNGGSLTIPASARNLEPGTHWQQKSTRPHRANHILLVAHDLDHNTLQETVIEFHPEATDGYDTRFDSYFLSGFAPRFYSLAEGKAMALNTLPTLTPDLKIPLGFRKNQATHFKITLQINTSSAGNIYLTDLLEKKTTDLAKSDYLFTATDKDPLNRFLLTFVPPDDLSPGNPDQITITAHGDLITINGTMGYHLLELYDISGRKLQSLPITQQQDVVQLTITGARGVYVVRLISPTRTIAKKFIM